MTKIHTLSYGILRLLLPAAIGLCYVLSPNVSFGQTYYSTFPDPSGKYMVTSPSGGSCSAPPIHDEANIADADQGTFAFFKDRTKTPYGCTNSSYTFKTFLHLPVDSPSISGGLQAGFRISVPTSISIARLSQNISIQTFLNDTLVESFSGSNIYFIDLATDTSRFIVYVNTSSSFNQLQLTVNSSIVPLNARFEFDVFYAVASNTSLLPVTISNYKAVPSGNSVAVSWQALNETNISSYRVEKSSNNGVGYTPIATIPVKSGSSAVSYSYTDKAVTNGNYLYRIVALDKDGSSKATNALLVTIAGKSYLVLVPSVVKAGQSVVVNSSGAGAIRLAVYDLQGRMVKEQQVNAGSQTTISTAGLSAGTYVVKIISAAGGLSQAKFIVN